MKTRTVVLLGICSLGYGLLSISSKAAPQNSKGLFDVYGCPLQVQCDLDGEWMNPEGEYHNGEQVSKKYGHDYYGGSEGKVHHYVVVHCAAKAAAEEARKDSEEQQKTVNALAAPFAMLLARNRANHQQEKNDLTAVVFCRQNPTGSWTFPGKAPEKCETLAKNVVAYCTVNPKKSICKDVAKLGPAPVPAQVAATPQVQPQSQQAPVTTQPIQNVIVSQPQAQPQAVNVTETPAPEVSVAEAARRNKAAKEAEKAKENPQPQP